MKDVRHSIPGWLECVASEHEAHELAYILPHDLVAGVAVRHMTLRDLLRLSAMECPFLRNFPPLPRFLASGELRRDAALTLSYLRVGYGEGRGLRNMLTSLRFRLIEPDRLYGELKAYMERTFFDDAGSSHPTGDIRSLWAVSTDVIDLFGSEYGWSASASLDMPYRQIVQAIRRIIRRRNPKAHIPTKSDEVVYEFLRKLNARKGEKAK